MKKQTLVRKYLPQNQDIEILVPNYKEPILPATDGGFGWYGLQAYNDQGQLMCHECGKFRDSLGGHIREHDLTPNEYRQKYGIRSKTKLVSKRINEKMSASAKCRNDHSKVVEMLVSYSRSAEKHHKHHKISAEQHNLLDSCPGQIIRRLMDATEIYGECISANQVRQFDSGLMFLINQYYGSLNKIKQIAKLSCNAQYEKALSTRLILEDMCLFYMRNGKWPTTMDYFFGGKLICGLGTVCSRGGIRRLRQEALKFRKEQEAAKIKGELVAQKANAIEIEYAGRARH